MDPYIIHHHTSYIIMYLICLKNCVLSCLFTCLFVFPMMQTKPPHREAVVPKPMSTCQRHSPRKVLGAEGNFTLENSDFEPKRHGGLVQMMFLFDWLIFRCPLVCSGVPFLKLTVHPRDLYWKPPSSGTMLVSGQFWGLGFFATVIGFFCYSGDISYGNGVFLQRC